MSAARRHYTPMSSEINTRSKTDLLVTHFKQQSESEWTSKVNKLAKKKKQLEKKDI